MVPLGSSYHPDLKILTVPQNFLTQTSSVYYNNQERNWNNI